MIGTPISRPSAKLTQRRPSANRTETAIAGRIRMRSAEEVIPSVQEFVAVLVNDVANAPQLASILSPGFRDTWSLQPEFRVAAPPLNVNMRWFRAVGGPEPEDVIEVRRSILDEEDGPMLPHGLQGMHGREIFLPRETSLRPDRHRLEERYAAFRQAAG